MNREAWWATVHGVAKSQIWLSFWARTLSLRGSLCLFSSSCISFLFESPAVQLLQVITYMKRARRFWHLLWAIMYLKGLEHTLSGSSLPCIQSSMPKQKDPRVGHVQEHWLKSSLIFLEKKSQILSLWALCPILIKVQEHELDHKTRKTQQWWRMRGLEKHYQETCTLIWPKSYLPVPLWGRLLEGCSSTLKSSWPHMSCFTLS